MLHDKFLQTLVALDNEHLLSPWACRLEWAEARWAVLVSWCGSPVCLAVVVCMTAVAWLQWQGWVSHGSHPSAGWSRDVHTLQARLWERDRDRDTETEENCRSRIHMTCCIFWCILMTKDHHKASQIQELLERNPISCWPKVWVQSGSNLGPHVQSSQLFTSQRGAIVLTPQMVRRVANAVLSVQWCFSIMVMHYFDEIKTLLTHN